MSVTDRERGAILPLFALMLVVLLAFAALTVDLGMRWVQRRNSQNAVDAAVMAGALEYLQESAPSSADVVGVVRDYVGRNITFPPDLAEWIACTDPDAVTDGFTPMVDADGNTMNCISLKQGATGEDETLLRVKLPDRVIDTAFASVVGIDTISVSAFAIAEIRYDAESAILPLSLPTNYGTEECLGTPPSGQLKLGEAVACTGPDSGNFGLLDSPFFEDHNVAGSDTNSCGANPYPNFATRTPFNLAAGIDHSIQAWPDSAGPIPPGDLSPNPDGGDRCDADTDPPQVPYVMNTQTGNQAALSAGLIGPGPYDGMPGRLRQDGGLNTTLADGKLDFATQGNPNFASVDNVGLWEYLAAPAGTGNPAQCSPTFAAYSVPGRTATDAIVACLDGSDRDDEFDHPEFTDDLLTSPRFSLVPVLSYERGDFTGNEWRAIVELKPVYLHTTWFDCGNPANNCLFHPEDWPPGEYSILFNPGEGTSPPIIPGSGPQPPKTPNTIELAGVSALVLEWEWLPDGAENQLGNNVPLEVLLYR